MLYLQLENLKNENLSSFQAEDHHFDPSLQGLQSELSQLETVRILRLQKMENKKHPAVHVIEQFLTNSS